MNISEETNETLLTRCPTFRDSSLFSQNDQELKTDLPVHMKMEVPFRKPFFFQEEEPQSRPFQLTLNERDKSHPIFQQQQQRKDTSVQSIPTNQFNQPSGIAQKNQTEFKTSQILTDDKNKKFVELDLKEPNVYESSVIVLSRYHNFSKRIMNLHSSAILRIQEKSLKVADIQKISILPETVKGKYFKCSISHNNQPYTFGIELKRELYLLPEHFVWFAKIINAKMMIKNNHVSANVDRPLGWNSTFCKGEIYKQSKYFKKWEKRYVVITTEGLSSYRTPSDKNPSIYVPMRDIKELSTSFDTHHQHLIIRLEYADSKVQFAIPIQDFCLKVENNWLLAFYRLLMEYKYHIKIA